ncbi:MAG: hypothetical protein HY306_04405 [Nitrosomonadales bacterium]|nr:hypothetical protein [Nitrosomonadales bacterium]
MQELLNHPAVQGGLAPFVAALIVAELLQRLRLSGLAIIAGFTATVYLASDFSFEPLTASRKIVLLGLASALLALPLGFIKADWLRPLLAVAGGVAAVWVMQRILQQQEAASVVLWGVGCLLYVGWLVFWMDGLSDSPVRAGSAGLALGLGSGGAALFGASALLGQFGLALGAAAGAYLLIQMITNTPLPCGRSFTLPLSLIAGSAAVLAVLTAELPWYALAALSLIPLAAKIPVPEKQGLWLQSLLLSFITLSCAAGAVYLTWRVAGAPPL